jgi:hypothetical protein
MAWEIVVGAIILLIAFSIFFGAPYVPSRRRYLERAFTELYPLGPDDLLLDIGSGDGVVLRAAAQRGARAVGFEINPVLVLISKLLARGNPAITIRTANFWRTAFPADTTIVYVFGVERDNARLIRKLQRETDRLGRPLWLLCLANPLKDREPERTLDAYALYQFVPLQRKEA